MNIILFEPYETSQLLPLQDPRALHILNVLRRKPGDSFDAGVIDGASGKATLVAVTDSGLRLSFHLTNEPEPLEPVWLVLGLPRPQTARKLLQEATSLGVSGLCFVRTERSEPGYASSTLWSSGEWRRHLIAGAQQAFSTRLPAVTHQGSLDTALAELAAGTCRIALDNYEASLTLSRIEVLAPVVLALGPERGWSNGERQTLRSHGFRLAHLGTRVLRTETACVAAISLIKASLGSI